MSPSAGELELQHCWVLGLLSVLRAQAEIGKCGMSLCSLYQRDTGALIFWCCSSFGETILLVSFHGHITSVSRGRRFAQSLLINSLPASWHRCMPPSSRGHCMLSNFDVIHHSNWSCRFRWNLRFLFSLWTFGIMQDLLAVLIFYDSVPSVSTCFCCCVLQWDVQNGLVF